MNFSRSLRISTSLAIVFLAAGCTSKPGGEPDPAGSVGGTAGSSPAGGSSAGGSSGAGGAPDARAADTAAPSALKALPDTAFVFERRVRSGERWVSQIYSFDLATNTEQLISKLDQDGGEIELKGLAVSTDRKWITFSEWDYRASTVDARQGFIDGIVWVMNVSGGDLRRITMPALPNFNQNGGVCAQTRDCAGATICVAGKCTYENFATEYMDPVRAPDDQSIFLTHWVSWTTYNLNGFPTINGGGATASVPVSGGSVTSYGVMGCRGKTPVAFHPDGKTAVVGLDSCTDRALQGFHEYTLNPFAHKRGLTNAPPIYSWSTTDAFAWLPDGSGILYIGYNTAKATGSGFEGRRQGLYLWDAAKNQHLVLFESPTDDLDVDDFGLSRDGKTLIVAVRRPVEGGYYNEFQRFDLTTGQLQPLPLQHSVIRPRW